ncbi:putative inositol polyphosphate 5-phosphatase [Paratrimastix pyriformis]|uniref:Inositol polyphosphate 5-phosphatase n=1 Tax=Paratrimastix pyriformis TaxID=342808 RepID=A0ABQ8UPX7_9EUKA|nr:putative inositol polyphosphate 5-phosphatase [Paratrimastix pyriformis]
MPSSSISMGYTNYKLGNWVRSGSSFERTIKANSIRKPIRYLLHRHRGMRTHNSVPDVPYLFLGSATLQAIHIAVFVKASLYPHVSCIQRASVATGVGNFVGNKGGAAISFCVGETSMLFISSHFEAQQDQVKARNDDYLRIQECLPLRPCPHTAHLGDLNYRVNGNRPMVDALLQKGLWEVMVGNDQLTIERRKGAVFQHGPFHEGPLLFWPTYRLDPHSDKYDTSAKARIPSWTDRILWRGPGITLHTYASLPHLRHSDHRPVTATFTCATAGPLSSTPLPSPMSPTPLALPVPSASPPPSPPPPPTSTPQPPSPEGDAHAQTLPAPVPRRAPPTRWHSSVSTCPPHDERSPLREDGLFSPPPTTTPPAEEAPPLALAAPPPSSSPATTSAPSPSLPFTSTRSMPPEWFLGSPTAATPTPIPTPSFFSARSSPGTQSWVAQSQSPKFVGSRFGGQLAPPYTPPSPSSKPAAGTPQSAPHRRTHLRGLLGRGGLIPDSPLLAPMARPIDRAQSDEGKEEDAKSGRADGESEMEEKGTKADHEEEEDDTEAASTTRRNEEEEDEEADGRKDHEEGP